MLTPGPRHAGATQILTAVFTENGVATDPLTVVAKTMSPACVEAIYTYGTDPDITKTATGNFQLAMIPDCAGRWSIRWIATYATSGTVISEDAMIVQTSPFVDSCCESDYA